MSISANSYHPLSVDAFCLAHVRGETTQKNYRSWLQEQRALHPELDEAAEAEQQADERLKEAA